MKCREEINNIVVIIIDINKYQKRKPLKIVGLYNVVSSKSVSQSLEGKPSAFFRVEEV